MEYKTAVNGLKWVYVVFKIHEKVREFKMRSHDFHSADEAIEQIFDLIEAEIAMQDLSLNP